MSKHLFPEHNGRTMSLLVLDQISRHFPSNGAAQAGQCVLDAVSLTVNPGEIVALIGRSGAGKTTLLYIAAGLGRPSSGRVLFEDRDLTDYSSSELSKLRQGRIGLVFQNNLSLSALPVWENAALPLLLQGAKRKAARQRANDLLERVGLAQFGQSPTASLSGGQRRRLGLARAMAGDPRLLLADEPTADLDEETSKEIEQLLFAWLREANRGALIVTHEPQIEKLADRVVCLEHGRLRDHH